MATNSKFLNKFDTLGNYQTWYQTNASNAAMVSDDSGAIYITGGFLNTVSFGSFVFQAAAQQMFIARLASSEIATIGDGPHEISDVLIYPNPTHEVFYIKFLSNRIPTELRMKNALGQIMVEEKSKGEYTPNIIELNTSSLPRGVYFVELTYRNSRLVRKIILH